MKIPLNSGKIITIDSLEERLNVLSARGNIAYTECSCNYETGIYHHRELPHSLILHIESKDSEITIFPRFYILPGEDPDMQSMDSRAVNSEDMEIIEPLLRKELPEPYASAKIVLDDDLGRHCIRHRKEEIK